MNEWIEAAIRASEKGGRGGRGQTDSSTPSSVPPAPCPLPPAACRLAPRPLCPPCDRSVDERAGRGPVGRTIEDASKSRSTTVTLDALLSLLSLPLHLPPSSSRPITLLPFLLLIRALWRAGGEQGRCHLYP